MSNAIQDEASYDSIDDYLGPGESRFFGGGYRRVGYRLRQCGLDPVRRRVAGRVEIDIPIDWSTKAAGSLSPHLTTIDAIVLAVRFSTLALRMTPGLSEASAAGVWLRRIDIKAPGAPEEHGLRDLPVAVDVERTEPTADAAVSTVTGLVGAMKVRCELVHPATAPPDDGAPLDSNAGLAWQDGPYGDALSRQRPDVRKLTLHRPGRRAEAQVSMLGPEPAATAVDAFVVGLQLGQVLLYDLDGLDRARSSTLWMRHTTITADRAPAPGPPRAATAVLDAAKLLDLRGARWRAATIVADCLGVQTRCAVAHELPTAAALRAA